MANQFDFKPPVPKPELIRPQALGDHRPVGSQLKASVLKDVAKQVIFNESGRVGGS